MAFLIGGANSAADTAFNVANSCRFNDGDSPSMSKTQGTATNVKIFTVSMWVKRCTLGADQHLWETYLTSGAANDRVTIQFMDSDAFRIKAVDGGSTVLQKETNRLCRDPSAWYHICVAVDTTQAVAANRCKIFINGTQETSFSTDTIWDQNVTPEQGTSSYTNIIGKYGGGSNYFDGYMAEVVFIDGSQEAVTSFGEFDEDTPNVFKPIDVTGLTFGTNGFYLDFEDSSNLGNDANGGTDLSESNLAAIDQTTDSPMNNFATINPLLVYSGGVPVFAEGNLDITVSVTGSQWGGASTIGVTAGKWYAECKVKVVDSALVGVDAAASKNAADNVWPGQQNESVGILLNDGNRYIDDSAATHGAALSADDILMIALDLTNENVYFGKNGQWFDGSGNADEASPNSAIGLEGADHSSAKDGAYFFAWGDGGGSSAAQVQWNFGNPPYANSSDAADANGYGAFEYAPPSGYLALCTKNLGSDGG